MSKPCYPNKRLKFKPTPSAWGTRDKAGTKKPNCPKFSTDDRRFKLRNFSVLLWFKLGVDDQAIEEERDFPSLPLASSETITGVSFSTNTVTVLLFTLLASSWSTSLSAILFTMAWKHKNAFEQQNVHFTSSLTTFHPQHSIVSCRISLVNVHKIT